MSYTYCGKNCESCAHKLELRCPECRTGPGKAYGAECAIAKCCLVRGHHDCAECVNASTCLHLKGRGSAAELRLKKQQNDIVAMRGRVERSTLFGTWMIAAFWVQIASIAVGLVLSFADDVLADTVSGIFSIVYALLLLKMGSKSRRFRIAGIFGILCQICSFLGTAFDTVGAMLIITLVVVVVGFVREYQEYLGYAEVTDELDQDLARNWSTLWVWQASALAGAAAGTVLTLIGFLPAALIVLLSSIISLVVSIIKLVYIYRSAKRIREYVQINQYLV